MNLDSRYRWYTLSIGGTTYTFRGATRKELRIAGTKPDKFDADNFILTQCVKDCPDLNKWRAGIADTILAKIYLFSGLTAEGLTWEEAMAWITNDEGAMEAAAVSMVAGCTLDVLENCDPFHYSKYLLLGKFAFESMFGIPVQNAFKGEPVEDESTGMINVKHVTDRKAPGMKQAGYEGSVTEWRKPPKKSK